MGYLLFGLIIIITLVQMIFFGGSILSSLLIILVSLGYILLKIFARKRLGKVFFRLYTIIGLVFVFVSVLNMSLVDETSGVSEYNEKIADIIEKIEDEDYNRAEDEITSLEEKMGSSDELLFVKTMNYLGQKNYESARRTLDEVSDKNARTCLKLYEQLYVEDPSANKQDLYDLYVKAANIYPEWEEMQVACAYAKICNFEYKSAQHYLKNALLLNDSNPLTLFYMGETYYYLKDNDNALYYFNESAGNDPDEEIKSQIAYFLNEMGFFEKEAE